MTSFTDILKRKADEIEPPKNLPVGTYLWAIPAIPKSSTLNGDKWDVLDFELVCLSPGDDVDGEALAEFGQVQGQKLRHRFMFNKEDEAAFNQTLYFLKQFCAETLGIDTEGKDIAQILSEVPGHRLLATVRWRPDNRPGSSRVFTEIGTTARAE